MARPVRIEYPGACYYITSKSVVGGTVFKDAKDRQQFLSILQEVVNRMRWDVYAYNLLQDSFQLFIKTPKPNLSKGMRQLNGVYTQRYNARYETVGNVFHGRFKAVLIEEELYFKDIARLIVRMPVTAKKARKLEKWKWSSYQATSGLIESASWLKTDELLSVFGKQKKRAQNSYIKFVAASAENPLDKVQGQILLGSDEFINKWKKQLATGKVMDKSRRRKTRKVKPLSSFANKFKDARTAMVKAYETGNYTLAQIGEYFGVHYSTVSRAVKKAGF